MNKTNKYLLAIASTLLIMTAVILWSTTNGKIPPPPEYPVSPLVNEYYYKIYNSKHNESFVRNYIDAYKFFSSSPKDKFDFLLLVYLHCNLDAGNWLYFCSEIQDDKNFFWKRLDDFIRSNNFKKLSLNLQKQIKDANESYLDDNNYFDVHL